MTDLEAANRALVMLGVSPIGSLQDDTQAARIMQLTITQSKKAVLSEYAWSFALRLSELTPSGTTPPPGFAFAFLIPSSAENIVQVYRGTLHREGVRHLRTHLAKLNFIVANGIIATNEQDCSVEYTYLNTNLETWSDAACEALCTRLAADCATTLVGGLQTANALLQKYQYVVQNAIARSSQTEDMAQPKDTHYIDVRW